MVGYRVGRKRARPAFRHAPPRRMAECGPRPFPPYIDGARDQRQCAQTFCRSLVREDDVRFCVNVLTVITVKYSGADNPGSGFSATPVPSPAHSSTPNGPPRSRCARSRGTHHQRSLSTPPRTAYRPFRARSRAPHLAGPTSSLSQPSWPSFCNVSIFLSKISSASGNASTARLMLSSRSKCRIGYGERLL